MADPVYINPHPLIRKSDELKPKPVKLGTSDRVFKAVPVLLAVELYNGLRIQADEIGREAPDRVLAPEFQPAELAAP